jgi:ABC-type transport system involved in cytochrome bd biosynthesis fused ATPase/permease subunit
VTAPASSSSSEGSTAVEPPVFNLSNLNVDFPIGKLSVVTGPTGSGKTACLTALLGEMELLEGKSYLPKNPTAVDESTGLRNSVAYGAQTPWLQQKSIKENILFGEELDQERYEATLEACALYVVTCRNSQTAC